MATIAISDLSPTGYDLFSDSESYMMNLSDEELSLQGGGTWVTVTTTSTWVCVGASVSLAATGAGVSYVVGRWL